MEFDIGNNSELQKINAKKQMSETQQYIFSILKIVLNALDDMNLQYYMQGGTMLGAVRHHGFIPWDDDVDLGMPREDYEIFLNNIEQYLPDNLELRTYWDKSIHHYYFARIVDNRYLIKRMGSQEVRYENVWLDIFPLDGMPNNPLLFKVHQVRLSIARFKYHLSCIKKVNYKRPGRPWIERLVIAIALKLPVEHILNTRKCLNRIDNLLKKYPLRDSEWITNFMGQLTFKFTETFKKDIYGKKTLYQFENIKMYGPEKYDAYLSKLYGDYMTPPKDADKNAHVSELVKNQKVN